jgi:hypothetical protein
MIKYFENSSSVSRNRIRVPLTDSSKKEMLSEMKKAKKVIGMEVEHGRGWIYVLPHGDCRGHTSLVLDYVCLCTNPLIEGGVKGTEQQLEALTVPAFVPSDWLVSQMSPSFTSVPPSTVWTLTDTPQRIFWPRMMQRCVGSTSTVAHPSSFQIHHEVKNYVGQVFEELDSDQADVFRGIDAEINGKEGQLR